MQVVAWFVTAFVVASSLAFEWETTAPERQGFSSSKLEALRADLTARRTKALLVVRCSANV